jgi:hypothetical protein
MFENSVAVPQNFTNLITKVSKNSSYCYVQEIESGPGAGGSHL